MTRAGERFVSLVTGATGFLGSALVANLLAQGHVVRCVVRGETESARAAKLRAALGERVDADPRGIEIIPGDLSKEQLGLSPRRFRMLGNNVDRIFHCGARVNLALPYRSLDQANVRATADLLAVAETSAASFSYVSSLAAVAHRVVGEPFQLTEPVMGGYAQTKWAADRLVSVAHEEGRVRAVIFRPGRVTADSRTARWNRDDLLERVLRICATLASAPILDTAVRFSPVDWVSQLIVTLSESDRFYGRAYHLIAPETLPWVRVLDILRDAGCPLTTVPYRDWRSTVVVAGRDDPAVARLSDALPAEGLSFDDRPASRPGNARTTLAQAFPEPPPAETLLAKALRDQGTWAGWLSQSAGRGQLGRQPRESSA